MVAVDIPDIPEELIEAGATGHLVVLVGAGASKAAGHPSWPELLKRLFKHAQNGQVTPEQVERLGQAEEWFRSDEGLLDKASFLRRVMGPPWIAGALRAELASLTVAPTQTHYALSRLPGTAFITTNYEALLERALEERAGIPPRVVLLSDLEGIRDFTVGQVLKPHGDLASPETVVLAVEDYFRVSHRAATAWKEKIRQLLQKPFQMLFVGYGYGDVDLQEIIDALRGAYAEKLPGPFWLQRRGVQEETRAYSTGLRPIWLTDFNQLAPWLEALGQAIDRRKAQAPIVVRAIAYAEKVDQKFEEDQNRAKALFDQQDFEAAQNAYQTLLDEAKELRNDDPERGELRRRIASCRVNIGACLANLQRLAEARDMLMRVAREELGELPPKGRAVLAADLAQLGERDLARAILPNDESDSSVRDARQLFEILEGRIPDHEPESTVLRLQIIQQLLDRGRLDEAARRALALLGFTPEDVLVSVIVLQALERALRGSVWEDPGAQWVPPEGRGVIVQAIEEALARLDARERLPGMIRLSIEQSKVLFYELTQERQRRDKALEALGEWDDALWRVKTEAARAAMRAEELARDGKLEEALAALPRSEHPWAGDFRRMYLAVEARRFDQALNEAQDLAERWPGRALIEFVAAQLLLRSSRAEEALRHARAAFTALPGRGYRVLLAKCLLQTGHYAEAQFFLESLADSLDPEILGLRAWAAERLDQGQALTLWELYLAEVRSQPAEIDRINLRIVDLLFLLGRNEEAAERAWRVFSERREQLALELMIQCGQVVRLGKGGVEAKEQLRDILKTIERRFPGVREAERFRLGMLATLGFPEGDPQKLVDIGVLQPVAFDDLKMMLQQEHMFAGQVYVAYLSGLLSFESFCDLTQTAEATWFTRLVLEADTTIAFCPPISVGKPNPLLNLEGQRLLVGHLELLLLQHLGLLGRLRAALGPKGRLIVFEDILARIVREAANLEMVAQHTELERLEKLIERLQSLKVIREPQNLQVDDSIWAKQQGLVLLESGSSADGLQRLSPRAIVLLLLQHGYLDRECSERLLRALPAEQEPLPVVPAPLPTRVAITYPTLLVFSDGEFEALDGLLSIIKEKLVIGPQAHALLLQRQDALRVEVRSAEIASALHRAVGAGIVEKWIEPGITRPDVGLPPLRNPGDAVAERLLREPLVQALSFRRVLEEDEGLVLLTADYFLTAALGTNLQAVQSLKWSSLDELAGMAERMRRTSDRAAHLPEIVSLLLPRAEAREKLEELVRLGFIDAVQSEDLIELGLRYGGLEKVKPARVLDRVEWMARQSRHVGSAMANLHLANLYAWAIWESFRRAFRASKEDLTDAEAHALTDTLLTRAERIDQESAGNLLEMIFANISLLVVENFEESLTKNPEKGTLLISPEGDTVPSRLWTRLESWTGDDGKRRAAYERAVRVAMVDVDQLYESGANRRIRSRALLPASLGARGGVKDPVIDAFTILSANWDYRLKDDRIEEDLQRWAGWLGDGKRIASLDEENFVYVSEDKVAQSLVVAPEAILLRVKSEDAFRSLARRLAMHQGPHDGRAFNLLKELSEKREDRELRLAYARMTVVAPWRLVREEPMLIRTWGWRRRYGERAFPSDLDDLCKMLSEPAPLHLGQSRMRDILAQRVKEGIWAGRYDVEALFRQACEVPGLLPTFTLALRIGADEEKYRLDVLGALQRLKEPEEVPAARLAGDILFLRVAAARRPYVRLPEREIDLREELPQLLISVLSSAMGEDAAGSAPVEAGAGGAPSGAEGAVARLEGNARARTEAEMSLARAEASLLRLCSSVVRDLAYPRGLPLREGLWLTWRLFQWFWAQMEVLPAKERREAMRSLHQVAPPPEQLPEGADDLLNPFQFDPKRFDHRLATVLDAISRLEEIPRVLPGGEEDSELVPRSVSSPALEKLLVKLASRPLSDEERRFRARGDKASTLDWEGAGAVPDMALTALLQLNNKAFFELPTEQRLRWILELPGGSDGGRISDARLAIWLLLTLTNFARRLSAGEQVAFEERLRTLEIRSEGMAYRLLGFTALFNAGQKHLEPEIQRMMLENLAHQVAPEAFENYLVALSFVAPERLESEAERVFAGLDAIGIDPVPFATGVGRVIMVGERESAPVAQALLRKLSERPRFKEDERMRQLLGTLGLRKGAS